MTNKQKLLIVSQIIIMGVGILILGIGIFIFFKSFNLFNVLSENKILLILTLFVLGAGGIYLIIRLAMRDQTQLKGGKKNENHKRMAEISRTYV